MTEKIIECPHCKGKIKVKQKEIPEEEPNPKDPSTWKSNKKSPKQIEVIWI